MKIIALAVFLAVMQTSVPVPRKASDNPAGAGTDVKTQPTTQEAPPNNTPPLANQNQPTSTNGNSAEKSHDNTEHSVSVHELPPVSVSKDWADWSVWLFSGLLVVVSFLQVWLLWGTLKAIQRQATLMESSGKQTDQIIARMKDTAERELRAYVCVSSAHIAFIQERAPEVQVHIKNSGQTPAYDVRMWVGIGYGTYPGGTLTPPSEGFGPSSISVLGPGEEPFATVKQYPVFPEESMAIIGTPELTLYIYGKIIYRDAFENERYTEYRLIFGGNERQGLRDKNGIGVAFLRGDTEGNNAT